MTIRLRPVDVADLPVLFRQQLDPEANRLAAVKPRDEAAFDRHWRAILADPGITARVILLDDIVVGSASCFRMAGQHAVGYWIAREHWGKGLATAGLAALLREVPVRPLTAWVASGNAASIRVLVKCGFRLVETRESVENERFLACTEWIYRLE